MASMTVCAALTVFPIFAASKLVWRLAVLRISLTIFASSILNLAAFAPIKLRKSIIISELAK